MAGRLLRGLGDDRHVQAAADDLGDLSERHALVGDRVIPGPRRALLQRQPEETGRIEPVHRGPAVEPVAHVRRNALLPARCRSASARSRDRRRHGPRAGAAPPMRGPRARPSPTPSPPTGCGRPRRSRDRARSSSVAESARLEGHGPDGDDERAAGARRQRVAERLDGAPVRLDGGPDEPRDDAAGTSAEHDRRRIERLACEKAWKKAVWIAPSAPAAPGAQAFQVFDAPRCASAPAATSDLAAASERASPTT